MKIILGITGASGAVLAQKAVDYLMREHELYVVASDNGSRVFKHECGVDLYDYLRRRTEVLRFGNDDMFAPIASGTNSADSMIILPCSVSTVGKIASGIGDTLLTRAAAVMLKERRRLTLCVRETPMSLITLGNLKTLALAGATVCPLSPPYYEKAQTVDEFMNLTLGRLLLSAGIDNCFAAKWNGIKE